MITDMAEAVRSPAVHEGGCVPQIGAAADGQERKYRLMWSDVSCSAKAVIGEGLSGWMAGMVRGKTAPLFLMQISPLYGNYLGDRKMRHSVTWSGNSVGLSPFALWYLPSAFRVAALNEPSIGPR